MASPLPSPLLDVFFASSQAVGHRINKDGALESRILWWWPRNDQVIGRDRVFSWIFMTHEYFADLANSSPFCYEHTTEWCNDSGFVLKILLQCWKFSSAVANVVFPWFIYVLAFMLEIYGLLIVFVCESVLNCWDDFLSCLSHRRMKCCSGTKKNSLGGGMLLGWTEQISRLIRIGVSPQH
jgi:hypothetical protein